MALSHGALGIYVTDKQAAHDSVCGTTTWINETTSKSALATDCSNLAHKLEKHKQQGWELIDFVAGASYENDPYQGITNETTCIFGIKVNHPVNLAPAILTHGDVSDILKDAVAQFTSADQRVGASGESK
ncbi:hypothetical protein F5Y08DRAFT_335251 [Xylaria arbuscula]|nr:hypothetical protein F5Y08DRAFT_335251 [Xylaria arbuscula]